MTEEDTFNKLCRPDFISVRRLLHTNMRRSWENGKELDNDERIQFLLDNGWTYSDYVKDLWEYIIDRE